MSEVRDAAAGLTWLRPTSLSDALVARAENPHLAVLAGGTDLMVRARERPLAAGFLDVFGLPELLGVDVDVDGRVRVGAATTFETLLRADVVQARLPMLTSSIAEIGAPAIRARGTLGGNVGTSSPVGDTLPVLLAYDAEVELASIRGIRRVPYAEFCTAYRRTVRAPDELIVAIRITPPSPGVRSFYRKVGTRRAQAISKVLVAVAVECTAGRVTRARVGLGAVADRPIRALRIEREVIGRPLGDELARDVAAWAREDLAPIDDVRSTKHYRTRVAASLLARAFGASGQASALQ